MSLERACALVAAFGEGTAERLDRALARDLERHAPGPALADALVAAYVDAPPLASAPSTGLMFLVGGASSLAASHAFAVWNAEFELGAESSGLVPLGGTVLALFGLPFLIWEARRKQARAVELEAARVVRALLGCRIPSELCREVATHVTGRPFRASAELADPETWRAPSERGSRPSGAQILGYSTLLWAILSFWSEYFVHLNLSFEVIAR